MNGDKKQRALHFNWLNSEGHAITMNRKTALRRGVPKLRLPQLFERHSRFAVTARNKMIKVPVPTLLASGRTSSGLASTSKLWINVINLTEQVVSEITNNAFCTALSAFGPVRKVVTELLKEKSLASYLSAWQKRSRYFKRSWTTVPTFLFFSSLHFPNELYCSSITKAHSSSTLHLKANMSYPETFEGWAAHGKDCLKGNFKKTQYKPKVCLVSSWLFISDNITEYRVVLLLL